MLPIQHSIQHIYNCYTSKSITLYLSRGQQNYDHCILIMAEQLSYLSCPNPVPLQYKTILDIVQEHTQRNPDKEICVERGLGKGRRSLTYSELLNRSTYIAKYLITKGVKPGDTVALIGSNSLEWIIGEFAIFSTGAVAVQMYKTSESFAETSKILESIRCNVILIDVGSDDQYMLDMVEYVNSKGAAKIALNILLLKQSTPSSPFPSLADVTLTLEEEELSLPKVQPESTAFILLTSGSTGISKMVEHTHFSVVNARYLEVIGSASDRRDETCYNDRPFCWIVGTPMFNIMTANKRVFTVTEVALKKDNILSVWNIIKEEQCTTALLLPYTLIDILENMDRIVEQGYKMYAITTGGQSVGRHITEIIGKCTEKLIMVYGSSETGGVSFTALTPDTYEEGYIGELIPGYEVKITGPGGNTHFRGELGDILVRSRSMLKSYRNSPELNAASFTDDGWFRSGDIGFISPEGKLFLRGKSRDVIKRGGMKVLISVVEAAISNFPEIKDVAVVPVPDKRLLEEVCACYILNNDVHTTEAELDRKCRKILGSNVLGNSPTFFLRFDSFPKLRNGKTDKIILKVLALEKLNVKD
ncbi:long-chain-fatty-acid--CoA ligase FadD13-like [Argopecten irradians]|uniref:long-chain-fatty-acid--CoA ligase FadD13-like n=1 Tax=Argopecten irradians TaxID=31199 RepID=UPI00371086E6